MFASTSIDPSIIYDVYPLKGRVGSCSQSQRRLGEWWGHQCFEGQIYRYKQPSPSQSQVSSYLHVFRLWGGRVPRENPCRHRENIQTERALKNWDSNREPCTVNPDFEWPGKFNLNVHKKFKYDTITIKCKYILLI